MTIEHWDLYRLLDDESLAIEGVMRELGTVGDLVLVEWGEPLVERGLHERASLLLLDPRDDGSRSLSFWLPHSAEGTG